jgi:hypothetical protein
VVLGPANLLGGVRALAVSGAQVSGHGCLSKSERIPPGFDAGHGITMTGRGYSDATGVDLTLT